MHSDICPFQSVTAYTEYEFESSSANLRRSDETEKLISSLCILKYSANHVMQQITVLFQWGDK